MNPYIVSYINRFGYHHLTADTLQYAALLVSALQFCKGNREITIWSR